MKKPCTWTNRSFDYRIYSELQVNIIDRLAGVPVRIEEKVRELSEAKLCAKLDGKWSIKEHIGHLIDLEELWKMRIEDFAKGMPGLSVWDVTNRKSTEAGHNDTDIEDLVARFRSERRELIRDFEDLAEDALVWESLHPRLRIPMKVADHSHFVAEHDDHHLAWIEWIKSH